MRKLRCLLLIILAVGANGCISPLTFEQKSDREFRQIAPGYRPVNPRELDRTGQTF